MLGAVERRKGGRKEGKGFDCHGFCGGRNVLIGCCGVKEELGLLARFWRSNALNEI